MATPYINEIDVLQYIDAMEKRGDMPSLGLLYTGGLAHPWRMTQILESLEARGLTNFSGRMATGILGTLRPLVEGTKHLEGPEVRTATARDKTVFAQRGVHVQVGDSVTDVGMACIAFNRMAREGSFGMALTTRVTLTDAGRAVTAVLDPAALKKGPQARPYGLG